ncbi:type 4a pilus biogenesis protein PilO [Thermodesulfovibrio sp. 1176]|uniref:type 4a pilus biogenesis protein PilO n=1 Tax=Thermodesulfovibrio sp. 1176 TaxID=3043424 RepID=UPI0024822688|nr:type 4a pilus biogenesis protein PilO [Thermodesulfovibrio sp. 1176]MDI1471123.1 type 4a pilus biogenesis protein PilO [Thermodesulfovibrio sp. 1176]
MKWEELSKSNRIALAVLIPLVIAVLFLSFYLMPTNEELKKLKAENKALQEEIDKANKIAAKYEQLKKLNEELMRKMEALSQLLPKDYEVSAVLKKVSEIGLQRGLIITLWRPKQKEIHQSKEIYEIPVEVSIKGKYHIMGNFFSDITGIERVINLKKIEMKSGQGEPTFLNVNLVAVTYSIIPDEEKKKLKEQKK